MLDAADYYMAAPAFVGCASDSMMLATSGLLWSMHVRDQQRELVGDKAFRNQLLATELGGSSTHAPIKGKGEKSLGIVHGVATVQVAAARGHNERAVMRLNAFGVVTKGLQKTKKYKKKKKQ